EQSNLNLLRELLDSHRPENAGGRDRRGFEWHYWQHLGDSHLLAIAGHADGVSDVAFNPNGRLLATCGDRVVRLWEAASGQELLALPNQGHAVSGVAFRPDGEVLAFCTGDPKSLQKPGEVHLRELATGRTLHVLRGHVGPIWRVAFSPDGRRLLS